MSLSIFPVKSTKIARKYSEALGSESFWFTDGYHPSAFSFETVGALHSVELGFLRKSAYCIAAQC